jgi:hypothetical protein
MNNIQFYQQHSITEAIVMIVLIWLLFVIIVMEAKDLYKNK